MSSTDDRWPGSSELLSRSRRSLAGGVSTALRADAKPHPLFFERAKGCRMWDVDGHELVDFALGWGAVILGHADDRVVEAVKGQLERGATFGAQHVLEPEVAETVLARYPFAARLVYSNTGTEAVMVSLRLARAWTGRELVLKFRGHYHGWSDPVLISYRPPLEEEGAVLGSRGQESRARENMLVARWNDVESVEALVARHAGRIAAVIAEPVLANSGLISARPGFLEYLRGITERSGALLILDEIITGFRTGPSGSLAAFDGAPDLVTLGKAVANGFPLSIVAGKAEIIDQVTTGGVVHAGTFNGNPVVLAAAKATLQALDEPGAYDQLEKATSQLAEGLRSVFSRHGVEALVNEVCGVVQVLPGVTSASEYSDYASANWAWYDALTVGLLERGVFVVPGGRLYLSLSHGSEVIDTALEAFNGAVKTVRQA